MWLWTLSLPPSLPPSLETGRAAATAASSLLGAAVIKRNVKNLRDGRAEREREREQLLKLHYQRAGWSATDLQTMQLLESLGLGLVLQSDRKLLTERFSRPRSRMFCLDIMPAARLADCLAPCPRARGCAKNSRRCLYIFYAIGPLSYCFVCPGA